MQCSDSYTDGCGHGSTVPMDPQTNMPVVPEGYRWRVESTRFHESYQVFLEYPEHVKFLWWSWTSWHVADEETSPTGEPHRLLRAAQAVMSRRNARLSGHRRSGHYPPKKLV